MRPSQAPSVQTRTQVARKRRARRDRQRCRKAARPLSVLPRRTLPSWIGAACSERPGEVGSNVGAFTEPPVRHRFPPPPAATDPCSYSCAVPTGWRLSQT
jgi:hypothetical protein